jgi:hypothetical protein
VSPQSSLALQIAVGLISEICIAALARDSWRVLRRRGARRVAFALQAVAYALAVAAPFFYWFVWLWQPWLDAALLVPFTLLYLFPGRLVAWTGGPTRLRRLWVALADIHNRWDLLFQDEDASLSAAQWLTARSGELDGYRSPESDELVDLWQARIHDRLTADDQEAYLARCVPRNTRINELHSRIFGGDSPPRDASD